MQPNRRIPSLDGLRAVSIALVLFSHAICSRGFPHAQKLATSSAPYFMGNLGVRIFFVISGFLITTLLVREQSDSGAINLKAFYLRRGFRILPVSMSYILVVALLTVAGVLTVSWTSFAVAGGFAADFVRPDWYLGHFWSLSVEEQFYLVWPFAVSVLPMRWRWKIAGAVFVGGVAGASLLFYVDQLQAAEAFSSYATVAAGCMLALARVSSSRNAQLLSSRWTVAGGVLLTAAAFLLPRPIRYGVLSIAVALLIVTAIDTLTRVRGPIYEVLNWKPVRFVGTLSYSLYIWQELFLRIGNFDRGLKFPLNLAAAAGAALCSYYVIEQPFIRLGQRQARKRRNRAAEVIADVSEGKQPQFAVHGAAPATNLLQTENENGF